MTNVSIRCAFFLQAIGDAISDMLIVECILNEKKVLLPLSRVVTYWNEYHPTNTAQTAKVQKSFHISSTQCFCAPNPSSENSENGAEFEDVKFSGPALFPFQEYLYFQRSFTARNFVVSLGLLINNSSINYKG